jgi:hypothetical protein
MFAVGALALFSAVSARAQWVPNGVPICVVSGVQEQPRIVDDGSGGAIIAWIDSRNGDKDIYAQRINGNGSILWAQDGVPVCTASHDQKNLAAVSDGWGGIIIAWQDLRSGRSMIHTQRLNEEGAPLWLADGLPLASTNGGSQQWPVLVSDDDGGAIIAWHDLRAWAPGIYAQRVAADGMPLWQANGAAIWIKPYVIIGDEWPAITSDGAGGAIIAWPDYRSDTNLDIYARRVTANGAVLWASNGVPVCTTAPNQYGPNLASDGAGGAIIAWTEDLDIRAQRIAGTGSIMWVQEGVPVCTAYGDQFWPRVLSDGIGGAIVAWYEWMSGTVGLQKLAAAGTFVWPEDGVRVPLSLFGSYISAPVTSDLAGGAIVAGVRQLASDLWLFAERVNAGGHRSWLPDGVAVCEANGGRDNVQIASDGHGGAIVAWHDLRADDGDIYANRVTARGELPVATLLQYCSATFSGASVAITWMLSQADNGVEFFIERAFDVDGLFVELSSGDIAREGLTFTYLDTAWEPGKSYWYRVEYGSGGERTVLFETGPVATPAAISALHQNHPNPFNPSTIIEFSLAEEGRVVLEIYDIAGSRVRTIVDERMSPGVHTARWDGSDTAGRAVASGVYVYRLVSGGANLSRKMVLLR